MLIMKRIFIIFLLLIIPQFAFSAEWKLDQPHTTIEFKIRHLMVSWVKGVFTDFDGAVIIDEDDISKSSVNITVAVDSIDTNNKKRDDHLRSPDFFDVAKYPTMAFVSKKVVAANGAPTKIIGDLTIRDVTREVELTVEDFSQAIKDPWGNIRRGASATAKINRRDYGLTWNKVLEAGGVVVGDEVHISLEVEMIKQ